MDRRTYWNPDEEGAAHKAAMKAVKMKPVKLDKITRERVSVESRAWRDWLRLLNKYSPDERAAVRRAIKRFLTIAAVIAMVSPCFADDHDKDRHEHEHHDYIIERQESGAVEGTPTSRIIIGRREIDVYQNGLMFEGNNVVGVRPPR
jgi:hypothetical protein